MKTNKLFYADTGLREFCATVVDCFESKKGFEIELDQTAFYPEGGGQAADKGTIHGTQGLHVHEDGERVLHLLPQPLAVGETVTGVIDYDHRFDLMQQHTGEHIVSGIINARYGHHNVGFHMGWDSITIDFDGPIPAEDLAEIERLANEAVYKNVPLHIWTPSPEELPGVFYRTKRALPWPVRIVQVGTVDSCACCGIHVAYTGEVGLIKIISAAKFHGGVRLEMVCGQRAWNYVAAVCAQNRQVSQLFSAKPLETAAAAQKIADSLAEEKYRCWELEKQLLGITAQNYVNCVNPVHFEAELSGNALRELAEQMNVTDKAVSKWERDLSCPDIHSIPKLAETLGVSVEDLMRTSEAEKKPADEITKAFGVALWAVALAMGCAVVVGSFMGTMEPKESITMLGVGVFCLALKGLQKE